MAGSVLHVAETGTSIEGKSDEGVPKIVRMQTFRLRRDCSLRQLPHDPPSGRAIET
jgi:hypothetical protein